MWISKCISFCCKPFLMVHSRVCWIWQTWKLAKEQKQQLQHNLPSRFNLFATQFMNPKHTGSWLLTSRMSELITSSWTHQQGHVLKKKSQLSPLLLELLHLYYILTQQKWEGECKSILNLAQYCTGYLAHSKRVKQHTKTPLFNLA